MDPKPIPPSMALSDKLLPVDCAHSSEAQTHKKKTTQIDLQPSVLRLTFIGLFISKI
jgi:hypothetical protein